jgi:hypothetical protein
MQHLRGAVGLSREAGGVAPKTRSALRTPTWWIPKSPARRCRRETPIFVAALVDLMRTTASPQSYKPAVLTTPCASFADERSRSFVLDDARFDAADVAHEGVARASAAPLVFFYEYIVDDADAKGEFYNWFGDSRRLLGPWRVLGAIVSATTIAFGLLPVEAAMRVLAATAVGTIVAGAYGQSILGGVMGDFLGATICVLELAIYLALAADASRFDASAFLRLAVVVSLPQVYGRLRNNSEKKAC